MECKYYMNNIKKLAITVSFIAVIAFFLTSCGKTSENGYKYPRNFPQACIDHYEKWWIVLEKMKASGRFDEASLKSKEVTVMRLLEGFKNPPRERKPSMEEYIQGCQNTQALVQKWSTAMDNAHNMSDEELARAVGVITK